MKDYRDPVDVEFRRYMREVSEGLKRGVSLLKVCYKVDPNTAEEIRRAVVVLTHAYLEDFMRTLSPKPTQAFSNVRELQRTLERLGLSSPDYNEHLPAIEKLMKRRHQIVHHADKCKAADHGTRELQHLDHAQVVDWLFATLEFTLLLTRDVAARAHRSHAASPKLAG